MKFASCLLMPALILSAGCGGSSVPEVATVRGTIKLDGKPLPDAGVTFIPQGGRPATARTDENGEYELKYNENTSGAIPGKNLVRISTATFPVDTDDGETVPGKPETVPVEYNLQSTLSFDVKPTEDNVADFDLIGGGDIASLQFDDAGE